MVDDEPPKNNNNNSSTWLGRYSFSRSVYHQIDSRRIPHVISFDEERDALRRSRSSNNLKNSESFRSNSSSSSSSKLSNSTCNGATPNSATHDEAQALEHNHEEQHKLMTKRIQSWSQYLENGDDEVRAVKHAENWLIDMSKLCIAGKFASGAHSRLYDCVYGEKKRPVALKILQKPEKDEAVARMIERQFIHEVSLLSTLHHPNIVQFVGTCTKMPMLCVVTEMMPNGSLRGFLHRNEPGTLPLQIIIGMAQDIARGMEYIHSQGVIHGDLKSENLVLDHDMTVKITDFGVARRIEELTTTTKVASGGTTYGTTGECDTGPDIGTYRWMAPEVIVSKRCSFKGDVYSFGIVLWELVTGMVPFTNMSPEQAAYAVVHKFQETRPKIPETCPDALTSLIKRCWSYNPDKRPNFGDILKTLERFEEASNHAETYYTWNCPSDRTKYFLGCFTRCKCPTKCNCACTR